MKRYELAKTIYTEDIKTYKIIGFVGTGDGNTHIYAAYKDENGLLTQSEVNGAKLIGNVDFKTDCWLILKSFHKENPEHQVFFDDNKLNAEYVTYVFISDKENLN